MTRGTPGATGTNPRPVLRIAVLVFGVLMVAVLAGLGTWQLFRLQWKLDLIARVEQRIHAAPVPAPGPGEWAAVTAAAAEYRRVQVSGEFRNDLATPVQAVTELGAGYWVMVPLVGADGNVTLINRGFVDGGQGRAIAPGPSGIVTVTGLLRMSEPRGGFLRSNDPAAGHWYSRDVAAIAAAHHLTRVAPYFIDAAAESRPGSDSVSTATSAASSDRAAGQPIGGLTVVSFHNNHLVYAITWYVLALMLAAACWHVRQEMRADR